METIQIAIDGPAGSGKSTVARRLSERLGYMYLDTGALYRALTLEALRRHVDISDETALVELLAHLDIQFDGVRTCICGEDVSCDIRTSEVSKAVSSVSEHYKVREQMVERQREIASTRSVVMDGRDIGTTVLPNAQFKFYLIARPEVRAKRRYAEMVAKGVAVSEADLLREMNARDRWDAGRHVSPMRPAADAVCIDTSEYDVDGVVLNLLNRIKGDTKL